jgi:hypothetical protein
MEIRRGTYEDLPDIEVVSRWACAEAVGELVPESAVVEVHRHRFRRAVLSEYLLARRLLVGESSDGRIEMVALVDECADRTDLTTVVLPSHPTRGVDGSRLVDALRALGWRGPLCSTVVLGNTQAERFHERAGFAPGEVVVEEIDGFDVVHREWWLDPAHAVPG